MTKKQLIENKIRTIVRKVLKESAFDTIVGKFAKLSGLTPQPTNSKAYPIEFILSDTMKIEVSTQGKFIMYFKLRGKDEYMGAYDSAASVWRAVQQGNYMSK
jgi:hypothetical protein